MLKTLRILAGTVLISLLLYASTLAVRDCSTGPYSSDNCLWLRVRERFGLRQSRMGRALALELVGLAILTGIILTVRYVFPRRVKSEQLQAHERTLIRSKTAKRK